MARQKVFDIAVLTRVRKKAGINQKEFWAPYGVTQSGGSRYESGRAIPKPLMILMRLHQAGKITKKDLEQAANGA